MRRILFALGILGTLSLTATAQDDPIEKRIELMKANGRSMAQLTPIVRNEQPFDAAVVMDALASLRDHAEEFDVSLYPEGTETGGGTRAAPAIWSDREGFTAAIDKFRQDIAAAIEANPQDAASLQAQIAAIGQNCSSCHQTFRLARD